MSEIKVTVSNYGRKFLYMRYKDPLTGKNVAKSTGTASMKEAVKIAAKWEAELQEGRYKPASKVTWQEFRERYETERLPALAANTANKVNGVFNAIEELIGVDKLSKLDSAQISKFQRRLREERKVAEATIKGMLAHLKACLNWAKKVKLLNEVPEIEMPTRVRGSKMMKGRGISGEEFDRIVAKVKDIVAGEDGRGDAGAVQRWKRFLQGLWWSGLRLGEAIDLSWDEPGHIIASLSGQYPMFLIPGDKQKSGQDQILPMAPEFAAMLLETPEAERTGRVFTLGIRWPQVGPMLLVVSRTIARMGEKAGVIVNQKPKKFASAHDFRRSFGERWSQIVMPPVLQQMMRHGDIHTTMKYYVGQNSQKAAAEIYAAFGKRTDAPTSTGCNTSPEQPETASEQKPEEQARHDVRES